MPEEMTEEEAFAIVFDLAEQNALDPDAIDWEQREECDRQQEALMICRRMLS